MPRLTRLDEIFTQEEYYFVTACTANRRPLLASHSLHGTFQQFAKTGSERGARVGRYVIMPDHIHLFVCFVETELGLSSWMKSLKNTLSKELRKQGSQSPHWQKGFFDHLLRSKESEAEKWLYVRDNPVRAGLVAHHSDWPYAGEIIPSSCLQ